MIRDQIRFNKKAKFNNNNGRKSFAGRHQDRIGKSQEKIKLDISILSIFVKKGKFSKEFKDEAVMLAKQALKVTVKTHLIINIYKNMIHHGIKE